MFRICSSLAACSCFEAGSSGQLGRAGSSRGSRIRFLDRAVLMGQLQDVRTVTGTVGLVRLAVGSGDPVGMLC